MKLETIYFQTPQDWRDWLTAHHTESPGIWMLFYKKHTGQPCITYAEALEEALCFGWIDSIKKRRDEDTYVWKFTPRQERSIWSKINREKAEKLMAEGRMTAAGLEKVEQAKASGEWEKALISRPPAKMPPDFRQALDARPEARQYYDKLSKSQRSNFIYWIEDAKRADTRARRIAQAVEKLAAGEKLF